MYKVYISLGGNEKVDLFLKDSVNVVNKEQEDELFFRREIGDSIIAYDQAFDLINDAEFTAKFDFKIEKADKDYIYSDYFIGEFYKRDCKIFDDSRKVEFKVDPIDKYSSFLEGMEIEFNVLNAASIPDKTPCTYNNISNIQVAMLHWIQTNDNISNKWKKITNSNIITGPYVPYARHFSLIPVDDTWSRVDGGYAFEINTSDSNINDVYDGVELRSENSFPDPNNYDRLPRSFTFGYDGLTDPPGSYLPPDIVWFIPNTYPTTIDESVTYSRSILFWDTLKHIINDFDPTVLFDTTSVYSSFFFDAINPITGYDQTLGNLTMLQKSDATNALGSAAKAGQITFGQMMEFIKYGCGCYWYIDSENRFRIEHRSFFDNGGVYFNINNQGTEDQSGLIDNSDVTVEDVDSNFTNSIISGGNEFVKNNDDAYSDHYINLATYTFGGRDILAKNLKVTFDYQITNFSVPDDTELIGLIYVIAGIKGVVPVDTNNANVINSSLYFSNKLLSELTSQSELRFYLLFKPKVSDETTERYNVLTGFQIDITDLSIRFYDVERIVNLDLTKYVSLKNQQNILENTNTYEYEYEVFKIKDSYEWQEEYQRNLVIDSSRTIKLDNLVVNYKDSDETDWIQNAESKYPISNFVSQINDYLAVRDPNYIGWLILDVDNSGEVKSGYVDLYYEQNASLYLNTLYIDFGRFNNVYKSYVLNDVESLNNVRYNSATLAKIKKQDEISGLVLTEDIDPIGLVKTNLGNGQIEENQVNLNSRLVTIKLKYDY